MEDGHFIDDPLMVVNVKPDFEGLGMEPEKQHPDYDPDNPCRTCEHWKWHSRKQDAEPMHSVGFHYCEMQSNVWSKKVRLIICAAHGYYKPKN